MSRVGKMPVAIPDKVTVSVSNNEVIVKGPNGTLKQALVALVSLKIENGQVLVERKNDTKEARAMHGLYRALIANMVTGVLTGFSKTLDLVGVGYRAQLKGKDLEILLGFSHPIDFVVPDGIKVQVEKQTKILISGPDKQQVGEVSAQIRRLRKPEPYKGKGVRYTDEIVRKKAGKTAASGK